MGKHKANDKALNKEALKLIRNQDLEGAARILAITSPENRKAIQDRIKRGTGGGKT
jgi:hypothetical protein